VALAFARHENLYAGQHAQTRTGASLEWSGFSLHEPLNNALIHGDQLPSPWNQKKLVFMVYSDFQSQFLQIPVSIISTHYIFASNHFQSLFS